MKKIYNDILKSPIGSLASSDTSKHKGIGLITILKLKYFANDICSVAGANNTLIPHLYIRFIVTAFASTNVTC
jgi:hypothetical protein